MSGDYLFHYTSISTLALILKNRNIRFNNLTAVDDIDEGIHDGAPWGKYAFISSWTNEATESIPMWSMYSAGMSGVRIKMKKNPFKVHVISSSDVINSMGPGWHATGSLTVLFPREEMFHSSYMPLVWDSKHILTEVNYNDPAFIESLKKEKILNLSTTKKSSTSLGWSADLSITNLGKYKNHYWDFQKEWRYILYFIPSGFAEVQSNEGRNSLLFKLQHLFPLPFSDYYLSLKDDAFDDMEILLGPKTTEADKCIVEALVEKYNPTATLSISSLKNHIR